MQILLLQCALVMFAKNCRKLQKDIQRRWIIITEIPCIDHVKIKSSGNDKHYKTLIMQNNFHIGDFVIFFFIFFIWPSILTFDSYSVIIKIITTVIEYACQYCLHINSNISFVIWTSLFENYSYKKTKERYFRKQVKTSQL